MVKERRKKGISKWINSSLLPVLSTALLAPAFLAGQVYAEEAQPLQSPVKLSQKPSPSETQPSCPNGNRTSATPEGYRTGRSTEAPAESPGSEEKDTVIWPTNDVHGRIVEEKESLETLVDYSHWTRACKTNQTSPLVVDAGDAFQGLILISNSSKGEVRAKILNQMEYDAMVAGKSWVWLWSRRS